MNIGKYQRIKVGIKYKVRRLVCIVIGIRTTLSLNLIIYLLLYLAFSLRAILTSMMRTGTSTNGPITPAKA